MFPSPVLSGHMAIDFNNNSITLSTFYMLGGFPGTLNTSSDYIITPTL